MPQLSLKLTATDIAAEIPSGDAVFYIGAGFSMVAGMPGWSALLDDLILELEDGGAAGAIDSSKAYALGVAARKAKSQGNYQYVASILAMHLSEPAIEKHVRSKFSLSPSLSDSTKRRIRSRLDLLMRAPVAGVITTNYDNLIESHEEFSSRFNVDRRKFSALGELK